MLAIWRLCIMMTSHIEQLESEVLLSTEYISQLLNAFTQSTHIHTYTYTHTHTYIYIYIYNMCVTHLYHVYTYACVSMRKKVVYTLSHK